jgi:hypothetical protein
MQPGQRIGSAGGGVCVRSTLLRAQVKQLSCLPRHSPALWLAAQIRAVVTRPDGHRPLNTRLEFPCLATQVFEGLQHLSEVFGRCGSHDDAPPSPNSIVLALNKFFARSMREDRTPLLLSCRSNRTPITLRSCSRSSARCRWRLCASRSLMPTGFSSPSGTVPRACVPRRPSLPARISPRQRVQVLAVPLR